MYFQWDFGSTPKGAHIRQNQPIPATGCTGPGLPGFVINIPVINVFFNPGTIPPHPRYTVAMPRGVTINPGATFTIDLYNIQQEVLMSQRN